MIPAIALSIRQPWAWAIVHAGKDIENRSTFAVSKGAMRPARIAVHAGKGMTQEEYFDAAAFMRDRGVKCPAPHELQRGGIIGAVTVVAIVSAHASPWFFGPRGLVLREAAPCAFIACSGALGYFSWKASEGGAEPPARWMIERAPGAIASPPTTPPDLFG